MVTDILDPGVLLRVSRECRVRRVRAGTGVAPVRALAAVEVLVGLQVALRYKHGGAQGTRVLIPLTMIDVRIFGKKGSAASLASQADSARPQHYLGVRGYTTLLMLV